MCIREIAYDRGNLLFPILTRIIVFAMESLSSFDGWVPGLESASSGCWHKLGSALFLLISRTKASYLLSSDGEI